VPTPRQHPPTIRPGRCRSAWRRSLEPRWPARLRTARRDASARGAGSDRDRSCGGRPAPAPALSEHAPGPAPQAAERAHPWPRILLSVGGRTDRLHHPPFGAQPAPGAPPDRRARPPCRLEEVGEVGPARRRRTVGHRVRTPRRIRPRTGPWPAGARARPGCTRAGARPPGAGGRTSTGVGRAARRGPPETRSGRPVHPGGAVVARRRAGAAQHRAEPRSRTPAPGRGVPRG
jgi:hypothetical protein